jgi:hypothetical protein
MKNLLTCGLSLFVASLISFFFPKVVVAAVLFDGIPSNHVENEDLAFNDLDAGNQRLADDFILSTTAIVESISFLGVYYPSNTPNADNEDSFTITIYNDSMGLLDSTSIVTQFAPINLTRIDTEKNWGGTNLSFDIYHYRAITPSLTLFPNMRYWLAIVNNTANDLNDDWAWVGNRELGNYSLSFNGGITWFNTPSGNYYFSIEGRPLTEEKIIPESTFTLGLLVFGALGAAFLKPNFR